MSKLTFLLNLLKGKGAAIELFGSAETSFLSWGAAEQQELVGGVHEFQLLSDKEIKSQIK